MKNTSPPRMPGYEAQVDHLSTLFIASQQRRRFRLRRHRQQSGARALDRGITIGSVSRAQSRSLPDLPGPQTRLRRPEGIPAILFWPAVIVMFPFALVVAVGMSLRLLRKPRPEPPVNSTPCGPLCLHAQQHHAQWDCKIDMGKRCDLARPTFTVKTDPNNCTMFRRKIS